MMLDRNANQDANAAGEPQAAITHHCYYSKVTLWDKKWKHGGFNADIHMYFKTTESSCSVAASRRITGQLHKSSTGSYVLPLTGPGDGHKGGGEV